MEALDLKADPRKRGKGHAKELRGEGLIPAVVYGKDADSRLIQIEARALDKVLLVAGTHQLISLQIGGERPVMTLAREIQRDPIKRDYLHVDFLSVKMDQKVNAEVPLVLVGEAPAIDRHGGILTQGLDQIEIECLPGDLLASIEIDVSGLTELNDSISVSDLSLPDTVTILSDLESMIAKIEAPRLAEELEELEEEVEVTSAEPEVITEARDEEGE